MKSILKKLSSSIKDLSFAKPPENAPPDIRDLYGFRRLDEEDVRRMGLKKGGMVKSSASKRADGIAVKGKTKGRIV
jgi:hypothetical protein